MKRIATLSALLLAGSLALGPAVAHAAYKDGLILVRKGQWAKAIKEFGELASTGHAPSQFSLGLIYHLGRGVPRDLEKAYNLYKESAMQDHPPAVNNIGMMYLNGEYVAKNQSIAFLLFEKASAAHSQAKDNLAQCYENGWGVGIDVEKAKNFYQLAGEEGYKLGYFHLAQLHEEGRGGAPVNIDEAIRWYQIAGEDSYAQGFYRIGEIYHQGIGGTTRDNDKAKFWYEQAEQLGYKPAIARLRQLR